MDAAGGRDAVRGIHACAPLAASRAGSHPRAADLRWPPQQVVIACHIWHQLPRWTSAGGLADSNIKGDLDRRPTCYELYWKDCGCLEEGEGQKVGRRRRRGKSIPLGAEIDRQEEETERHQKA